MRTSQQQDGGTAKAKAAYQEFFTLWKDADSEDAYHDARHACA